MGSSPLAPSSPDRVKGNREVVRKAARDRDNMRQALPRLHRCGGRRLFGIRCQSAASSLLTYKNCVRHHSPSICLRSVVCPVEASAPTPPTTPTSTQRSTASHANRAYAATHRAYRRRPPPAQRRAPDTRPNEHATARPPSNPFCPFAATPTLRHAPRTHAPAHELPPATARTPRNTPPRVLRSVC